MENQIQMYSNGLSVLGKGIIIGILLCLIFPSVSAISSENKIIYDLPLFDNYGPAFATWSGEGERPLGNALLKGKVTLNKEEYNPGDTVKIVLDLIFSATIISGKYGALMNELGYDTWMLKTDDFLGYNVELGQIKGSEFMGIGPGQEIPPLMLRNVSHTYEYEIPDAATSGNYDVYAFIENSEYKTNPVTITISGGSTPVSSSTEDLDGFSGLTVSKNFDEDTGESFGITDTFALTDERVCVVTSFDPLPANGYMEFRWYDPSGEIYYSGEFDAEEGSDWAYGSISISDAEEIVPSGEWELEFLYNGKVIDTTTFVIESE